MTVKELRKVLKQFGPNAEVWFAADAEGNRFLPVTAWGFHTTTDEDHDDDNAAGDAKVVLWP